VALCDRGGLRVDLERGDAAIRRHGRRHDQRADAREGPDLEHVSRLGGDDQELQQPRLRQAAHHLRRGRVALRPRGRALQLATERARVLLGVTLCRRRDQIAHCPNLQA